MNKMTRAAGTALALLTLATPAALAQTAPKNATVAVTAIVEHPALDATRDGVRDELAAQGWKAGENLRFDYQSAQGNPGTAVQIARQFVGQGPDVIIGFGPDPHLYADKLIELTDLARYLGAR